MLTNEQHYVRIIDDLKAQLGDKSLELASARSIADFWKEKSDTLQQELENVKNVQESRTEEPTVHVVTTKQ